MSKHINNIIQEMNNEIAEIKLTYQKKIDQVNNESSVSKIQKINDEMNYKIIDIQLNFGNVINETQKEMKKQRKEKAYAIGQNIGKQIKSRVNSVSNFSRGLFSIGRDKISSTTIGNNVKGFVNGIR